MKRLYKMELIYYVMAESREEAREVRPEIDYFDTYSEEATSVDFSWWDAIPFGGDDDRTCGEILKEQREEKRNGYS